MMTERYLMTKEIGDITVKREEQKK